MVLLFEQGMHLVVQIWKRRSNDNDEFFEWLTSTHGLTGAWSKEPNVVRQNIVRYFESSLAH